MAQRWYQKATVQAVIVTGAATIIIAVIYVVFNRGGQSVTVDVDDSPAAKTQTVVNSPGATQIIAGQIIIKASSEVEHSRGSNPITNDEVAQLVSAVSNRVDPTGLSQKESTSPEPKNLSEFKPVFYEMWEHYFCLVDDKTSMAKDAEPMTPSQRRRISEWLHNLDFSGLLSPTADHFDGVRSALLEYAGTRSNDGFARGYAQGEFIGIVRPLMLDFAMTAETAKIDGYPVLADRFDAFFDLHKIGLVISFSADKDKLDRLPEEERVYLQYLFIYFCLFESRDTEEHSKGQAALLGMDPDELSNADHLVAFRKLHDSLTLLSKSLSQGDEFLQMNRSRPISHFARVLADCQFDRSRIEKVSTDAGKFLAAMQQLLDSNKPENKRPI